MRPVVVCFAGDVWDGNPHSRHHLARRLVRNFDVLFVEGVPMRSIATGDRHELRRLARKFRVKTGLRTVAPGLHVLSPLPVPPAGSLGRGAQLSILRRQVARALAHLHLNGPRLIWFSLPVAAPLLGRLGESASLFYYQDRYDAFSHVDGAQLAAHVQALAEGCDVSVATSEALAEDLRRLGAAPVLVRHGVEPDRFDGFFHFPDDLAPLERPLVGCVGLIDDHMDMEVLNATADHLQQGTVVMVGDSNISTRTLSRNRIALVGRRPYRAIPAYISAFDCCIVPFAMTRLTEAVNPIKLREYLAAGRPVVSTALPEVLPYGDVVEVATGPDDFAAAVIKALEPGNDNETARERRRMRVAGETWDHAAAEIRSLIEGALGLRERAGGTKPRETSRGDEP